MDGRYGPVPGHRLIRTSAGCQPLADARRRPGPVQGPQRTLRDDVDRSRVASLAGGPTPQQTAGVYGWMRDAGTRITGSYPTPRGDHPVGSMPGCQAVRRTADSTGWHWRGLRSRQWTRWTGADSGRECRSTIPSRRSRGRCAAWSGEARQRRRRTDTRCTPACSRRQAGCRRPRPRPCPSSRRSPATPPTAYE